MPSTPLILLIEDHEGYAYLVQRTLRALLKGATITVVSSGADAVTVLERDAYDLVLLDLDLPGVPGLEVLRGSSRGSRTA